MCKDDEFILQPYFTPMIEREFPELIKARKEFETKLKQNLNKSEES